MCGVTLINVQQADTLIMKGFYQHTNYNIFSVDD